MQSQLVSSHGMLAVLEVLEGNCSREVNTKLLHIVNLVYGVFFPFYLLPDYFLACHGRCRVSGEFLSYWVCLLHFILNKRLIWGTQRDSGYDGYVCRK